MVQFGRKKSFTDYFYTKPVIAVLLIVVGFLSVSVFERFQIEREMAARRIAAEAEYQALEARKADLEDKVDYLSGERGIEEEIRKHFDVAKTGEKVIILLGDETVDTAVPTVIEPSKRWYQFWR